MAEPVARERPPLETVPCAICGSQACRVVYEARDDRAALEAAAEFRSSGDEPLRERLVQCADCGLQYVSPRLRHDVVLAGYAAGADESFVSEARGREATFARCLKLVERHTGGRRGRLLDVGTAGGSFLHVARRRGWLVDGCEPNRWLCAWAREHYGLEVRPGTLFEQDYESGGFDVVSLWDVLEHTPDPKAVVAECHRVLRDDGLFVVNYPDIGSWIARLMGRRWVFLLSVHLYYFTRDTLTHLLEDAGFRVVAIRPHIQRLSLSYICRRAEDHVGWPARALGAGMRAVGLGELQAPYWVGQTIVLARRVPTAGRAR